MVVTMKMVPRGVKLAVLSGLACSGCAQPSKPAPPADTAPAPVPSVSVGRSAATTPSPAPAASAIKSLHVEDVDWRSGGWEVFLRADGSGVLRRVDALEKGSQSEKRYELSADPARMPAFERVLDEHDASGMKVDPLQAPGDDLATLVVERASGAPLKHVGALARNEAFGKMFVALRAQIAGIDLGQAKLVYTGVLDKDWAPPRGAK